MAAYAPLRGDRFETALLVAGAAAVVLVLAALVLRSEPAATAAVVLLGCAYTGALFAGDVGVDLAAPAFGALLLLLHELVAWSLQERVRVAVEAAPHVVRAAGVAAVSVAGAALGVVALSTTALSVRGGLGWEVVGVAAAVAVVAVVVRVTAAPS